MTPVRCYIRPTTCGRTACENDAMAFWQSRDPKHRVMHLTDLTQLAKDIRRAATSAATYHITAAANTTPAPANPCVTIADFYALTMGACRLEDAQGRADGGELSERTGVPAGSREACPRCAGQGFRWTPCPSCGEGPWPATSNKEVIR